MTGQGGLRISVDARAVDWIQRHGGVVTLRQSPRHGCCGGTALLPVAEARTPATPDGWTERRIDGVTVYIARELEAQAGPLTIRAEGFRQWRRLFVETTGTQTQAGFVRSAAIAAQCPHPPAADNGKSPKRDRRREKPACMPPLALAWPYRLPPCTPHALRLCYSRTRIQAGA